MRRGGAEDVGAILSLFDDAVAWLTARGQSGQWGSEPWSRQPEAVARVEDLAREGLWMAEADGEPVGALVVSDPPPYVEPATEPEVYIMLLLTSRRRAGEGLGARLVEQAESLAREAGANLLRVDCWAGAPGLIRWYERQGFERSSTYAVGDWTGQVLEKRLSVPGVSDGMDPRDVAVVLDRCDEVLASSSLRGHFVADVPVDAFWPALAVAALVVDGRRDRDTKARLERLDAAGIKAVTVRVQLAALRQDTVLRRLREIFDEDPPPRPEGPLDPNRAKPVLAALLGAGALARRAAQAGEALALAPGELEALGVLAGHEPLRADRPPSVEGLATAIAVEPGALVETFARLADQDLVRSVTSESELRWQLTDSGRSAVAAWLARCDGLLAGWPPPPSREVDDVV